MGLGHAHSLVWPLSYGSSMLRDSPPTVLPSAKNDLPTLPTHELGLQSSWLDAAQNLQLVVATHTAPSRPILLGNDVQRPTKFQTLQPASWLETRVQFMAILGPFLPALYL